ncbi:MAG TPA: glycoside hydrolase family 3 C-terminal domain-containing protein [Bacteroidaceae bacterium]|nr:glycoside hydrolase family 3 C-terminal domain-containing protein [Bacteroidaceae bacterium]
MKRFLNKIMTVAVGLSALFGCNSGNHGYVGRSKLSEFDKEAINIVSQMTLQEKVDMMHGKYMFVSAGIERLGISDMQYADGPFGIREELESKSWNPLRLSNDSATFFPTGSALAATWSPELAYEYGVGLAREARLRGKDMLLGPAINIQRIPTGGRTYEYLSEDPFLSSRLSVSYTRGVQDNGVAVCLKHYALNNQENNRGTVNVVVSPRAMREIYLPPFQAAVIEGDAYGVMAAYNKVNGRWCSENDFLQNRVLRDEWGFKGMIISDWGGTHSTVDAVNNGLNVEMPGDQYLGQALIDSVINGKISEKVIDERVKDILRVRMAIEPIPSQEANKIMTAQPEQAAIAYRVAAKSIVLLKNDNSLLPLNLNKIKKIAVIGDNATRKMSSGGVGAGVKAYCEITPLEGLKSQLNGLAEIVFAQGYSTMSGRYRWGIQPETSSEKLVAEALKAAKDADVVIFIGGNNREVETEGSDRTTIELPFGQDNLLKAISEVNENIITVLVAGAPVDLNRVNDVSSSIVVSWFNGSEGGNALADVLVGNISPSGKLPFTYPIKLEDSPAYAMGNYPQTDVPISKDVFVSLVGNEAAENVLTSEHSNRNIAVYSEDMLVGYRWFDTKNKPVMYPFGHGLSYTTFDYDNIIVSKNKYSKKESIEVTFELNNTGEYEADEVVQLYVSRIDSKVEWPFKELKAFKRISLKPGESKTVTLSVPVENLKYWNEKKYDWVLEHGVIELLIGSSSADIRLVTRVNI